MISLLLHGNPHDKSVFAVQVIALMCVCVGIVAGVDVWSKKVMGRLMLPVMLLAGAIAGAFGGLLVTFFVFGAFHRDYFVGLEILTVLAGVALAAYAVVRQLRKIT